METFRTFVYWKTCQMTRYDSQPKRKARQDHPSTRRSYIYKIIIQFYNLCLWWPTRADIHSIVRFCYFKRYIYSAYETIFPTNACAVTISLKINMNKIAYDRTKIQAFFTFPGQQVYIRTRIQRHYYYSFVRAVEARETI